MTTPPVQAPATLPADFFAKQPPQAPATLPADFFSKQPGAAPVAPYTGPAKPEVTPAPDQHPYLRGAENFGEGILKGAGQLVGSIDNTRAGNAINSFGGLRSPQATQADTDAYQKLIVPHGTAQKLGAATENLGEGFLLPEVKAALPLRLAAQAGMGAALSSAHGGSALAGALGGAGAEGISSGLTTAAPTIAEAGIGARAVDRAYGKTPGLALLNDTKGLRPATIATSARGRIGELTNDIDNMANEASRATVVASPNRQLALPPGPVPVEQVPLHEATAVVERPSGLQPAAASNGGYVGALPTKLKRTVSGKVLEGPQAFTTSTAADMLPPRDWQLPAEEKAQGFMDRLHEEGGNGVTYPSGKMPEGAIAHPLKEPLRTTRMEEPAQGVWLRRSEGPIGARPITPADAGFQLRQPTVSLRQALARIDAMIAKVPENSPTELNSLQRVRAGLTQDLAGAPIPEEVPPARALALKRGLRTEFGKYRGDPTFDSSVASGAAKSASRDIDHELDSALGPEFASKNQRVSSLIDVRKLADRASRNAPIGQRIAGRLAAHTGALTAGGVGSVLGYEKGGIPGAFLGGAAGIAAPELLASRPALIGVARAANSPITKRLLRGALVGGATAATKK